MPAANINEDLGEERLFSSKNVALKPGAQKSIAGILLNHSPFPVMIFDAAFKVLDVNTTMEKVMGLKRARVLGNLATDVCPFCNTDEAGKFLEQIFNGKTINLPETKYNLPENKNQALVYNVIIEPVLNNSGVISGGILIAQPAENHSDEISYSDSILAEAELLAGFGTWEWNTFNNEIKWSKNLYAIYGMEPYEKEINLENFINSVYPQDLEIVNQFITQIIQEKKPVSYQHRIFRKDGSVRTVTGRSTPFFDKEGILVKVAGCTLDITETEETQRQLEAEKDFSEYIINNSTYGICTFDEDLKYTAWNATMVQLTGVSSKKALGKTVWQLFPGLKSRKNEALFQEVLKGKKVLLQERATEEGDGFFEANMVPLRNKRGNIIGGLIMVKDITARKMAEFRLTQKNKELELSNKELERFADVVSHDLKEPLRMISNYTQMFARKYENMLDNDAKEFIHYALEGVHRIQLVISDLITYNSLGTQKLKLSNVNSGLILRNVLKELDKQIQETNAIITYGTFPEVISCNKQMIGIMFYNLIENAIKFSGNKRPEIHISAEKVHNEWHFSVKDNGIGIDKKYGERIFIIFQRLHDRNAFEGTGIGLAMCRKIMDLHKGKIWYDSVPGQGTTFTFSLPA